VADTVQDPIINIDGKMEPQSRVIAGFKERSVFEQKAIAAANEAAALKQQMTGLAANANAYANLQALIASDPDAAKAKFDRIIAMAKGELAQAQATPGGDAATEAKLALRVQQMEAQMAQLAAERAGSIQVSQIRSAMDEYPVFKNSPEARRLAESFTASLRAQDPNLSIKDAVSAVHTDMQKMLNAQTAASVTGKEALAAAGGGAPPQAAATPGITSPEKLGKGSLKDGSARALFEKALTASLLGSRGATT